MKSIPHTYLLLSAYCTTVMYTSAPLGPPLNFEIMPEGPRTLTFSWDPPAEDKRNGIITGYLLSCDPQSAAGLPRTFNGTDFNQMGGVDPITLSGFTPFTTYNCSVIASDSAWNGFAATTTATTEEDCKNWLPIFQLHIYIISFASTCTVLSQLHIFSPTQVECVFIKAYDIVTLYYRSYLVSIIIHEIFLFCALHCHTVNLFQFPQLPKVLLSILKSLLRDQVPWPSPGTPLLKIRWMGS